MRRPALISLGGRDFRLGVLLDSGALNANYISKTFIDKNRALFQPHISYNPVDTKMADGKTILPVEEWLDLTISLAHKGEIITARMPFGILSSCSQDAIVGLPGIFYHFFDLFIALLRDAKDQIDQSKPAHQLPPGPSPYTRPPASGPSTAPTPSVDAAEPAALP